MPERGRRRAPVRPRSGHRRNRGGGGPRQPQIRHTGVRQAIAGCDRHSGRGRCLHRVRHRRTFAHQRAARHGHRSRHDAPGAGRRLRRVVRARHQAGRGTVRVASIRSISRCADHRDGRRTHRPGCGRVAACGRLHDRRGQRADPRSVSLLAHRARTGGGSGRHRGRPGRRHHRPGSRWDLECSPWARPANFTGRM